MGSVHAISEGKRVSNGAPIVIKASLSATVEKGLRHVRAAYAKLSTAPGYHARPEQQQLSEAVTKAILENSVLISEAPTGSGKTIGYSIGALAAAKELGIPVVIATATVALQGQVMSSDLRRLEATGLVRPGEYRLVRGRGRYFCPVAAQAVSDTNVTTGFQPELFDEHAQSKAEDAFEAGRIAPALLTALDEGAWDGTRDSLPEGVELARPSVWGYLSSSPESCLRHNCERFKSCPFFKARAQWESAEVLVANHNLVLLDLEAATLGADGKPKPSLFPFKEYILVVDESHHLPDTALAASQSCFKAGSFIEQLNRLDLVLRDIYRNPEIAGALRSKLNTIPQSHTRILREAAMRLLMNLNQEGVTDTSFDGGGLCAVTAEWSPASCAILASMQPELDALNESLKKMLTILPNMGRSSEETHYQVMASALGALAGQIKHQTTGIAAFLKEEVRWLSRQHCTHLQQGWQPSFHGSPREGKAKLAELLWSEKGKKRVRSVYVSATLRGTTGFDHYIDQMGLVTEDGSTHKVVDTQVLPSRFAYETTRMTEVSMAASPRDDGYLEELLTKLPLVITPRVDRGTLVLFTNRKTMRQAYEKLRMEFGDMVICQDTHGGAIKVKNIHTERVDQGMPSILLGVKSLAEGFDLPGVYCTHLVVTQLPFEAPTSPLERARQEAYGDAYFEQHVLPRTARELKQITGRLLRREDDWGRISVMDNRLFHRRYGEALIDSLPPYARAKVNVMPNVVVPLPAPSTFMSTAY